AGTRPGPRGSAAAERRGGPPRLLGESLAEFLRRSGLAHPIEERKLFAGWERIVGPALAKESTPMRIEKGVLWIGVKNAPQANHLLYLKPQILTRLRREWPQRPIRDVRVLHRPAEGTKDR
ncbi:MAG: DUF721 domain-containing protein, partial [Candidatus Eisenbacteria bacterium]|nr:DUF721 domain-containing protein [Candidatus Eisenbacteria bacterium]